MRVIPEESEKSLLINNKEEYRRWLSTMEFLDAYGRLIEPNYDELTPPDYEYPLIITFAEHDGRTVPFTRVIGLN